MSSAIRYRLTLLTGIAVALAAVLLPATNAAAVEAAASWKIYAQTNSSVRAGEPFGAESYPAYFVHVKNIGEGPTVGPYSIVMVMPSGITPEYEYKEFSHSPWLNCKKSSNSPVTITCSGSQVLEAGKEALIGLPFSVAAGATGPFVAQFEIEGGGIAPASTSVTTPLGTGVPAFNFLPAPLGASSAATDEEGAELRSAGRVPFMDNLNLNYEWQRAQGEEEPIRLPNGGLKNLEINLPQGEVVDPQSTPVKCTEVQLESFSCPKASQIGTLTLYISLIRHAYTLRTPLYNLVPTRGAPAVFGAEVLEGIYVHVIGKVRSESDYGLSATIKYAPAKVGFLGVETELWGVPTAASHDYVRGRCSEYEVPLSQCELESTERTGRPGVILPTSCGQPLVTSAASNAYGEPAEVKSSSSSTPGLDGCNQLSFEPTISAQATTPNADSPTGLSFDLHIPQAKPLGEEGPPPASTANLRNATVTLPAGMSLNPSAGNGLAACTPAQIGLKTPVGQANPAHFDESLGGCPAASKLGTVQVVTPLLEDPLQGSVYLAQPFQNPFGSQFAIYLAVEDEQTGVVAKLPGRVDANPTTGQLTASFIESPELPIEDVKLSLFNGPKASLKTSPVCGAQTTSSTLTPWTSPEGADAHPADSFQTSVAASGSGPCPTSEAAAPAEVSFSAGSEAPLAGAYSSFSLRIARKDGTQHITGIETLLPEGLLGKLAGISYCPASGIAQARSREVAEQGKLEQASPSCPASSEVGTVQVTAGAGITPIPVDGHVYLAGPYKGAPISLVTIVPAVAGPFDLGTVVDRVALNVGEFDARIHAVADPLPTIRDGVPLDVRSIELKLDRSSFTRNPTSCEAMAIEGSVATQAGQTAPLKNGFQVGECNRLAFKPKLKISLSGPTKRTAHPALKAVVTMPAGDANIARAQVALPHAEFLDQGNLNRICSQADLKAGTCPAKTIYGHVKAWTPLLDQPLEGNVYLAGGFGYKLPALVGELNGQIRVLLVGKVDTGKSHGIRNTFEAVPDAPVSRFVLSMKGGAKYGLLQNSENVCKKAQKAEVLFAGQNGKTVKSMVSIANSCNGGKGKKHRRHAKKGHPKK